MDEHELLVFVVRAFLARIDGTRDDESMSHDALAIEAGVEPYHVKQAIETMRGRRWISGVLGGHYASTRDGVDQMRAFANPLPPRRRTRAEIERDVASALLERIQAKADFTLDDLARDSRVHLGNVRRLFTEWEADESGLVENGSGEIDWNLRSVPYLEAVIADPVDWGTDSFVVENHHHGDAISGDKHHVTIQGSTIGAVATGTRSSAHGTVNTSPVSLEDARAALRVAACALVDVEDDLSLDESEELHQLLRMLKSVQIEVSDLAENQRRAKAVIDEMFAAGTAEKLKAGPSSAAEEVLKALLGSPVFAELVKAIIPGGVA